MKIRVFMATVLLLISTVYLAQRHYRILLFSRQAVLSPGRQPIIRKPPDINLVNLACKH